MDTSGWKTCSVCRDDFDPAKSPHTRSRCRPCTTKYKAEWRKTARGAHLYAEGLRRYTASDKGKAANLRKRNSPNGRLRALASSAVGTEVHAGRMIAAKHLPCYEGPKGCSGKNGHHHDSYEEDKRLDVRCLCRAHHEAWHAENEPIYPAAVRAAQGVNYE